MHDCHFQQQLDSDEVGLFQLPGDTPLTFSHSKRMGVPSFVPLTSWTGKIFDPLQIRVLLGILDPMNVQTAYAVVNAFNAQLRKPPRLSLASFPFTWSSQIHQVQNQPLASTCSYVGRTNRIIMCLGSPVPTRVYRPQSLTKQRPSHTFLGIPTPTHAGSPAQ